MKTAVAPGAVTRLAGVTVREAMHEGVIKCPGDTPLGEVARLMASRRVHAIVSTDVDNRELPTWSVVSDLDLISLAAVGNSDATARDAATTEAVVIAPGETLERAAQLMHEHGVAHLLVVAPADGRPLGVLSTLDIAGAIAGGVRRPRSAMHVADVMHSDVVTVTRSTSLKEVARLLVEHSISGVPVVEDGEVLGVVSERDLLEKQRVHDPQPDGLLGWILGGDHELELEKHWARTAGDAMSAPARTIEQWRSVSAAASLMAEEGLKRLPVVHEGELVGIITRADVVRAFARSDAEIERDIREEVILRSYWVAPTDVEIVVLNGYVKLDGSVDGEATAQSLPAAVATVPGVVSVESYLTVRR
ncbi:MAG: CBS domain-containing protein [Gaiellaceae bacterium]